MTVLVKAHDLSIYADHHHQLIVDSASFQVHAGEILAIIGPNGAGKSTLLKCLSGEKPFSGSLDYYGFSKQPKLRARQIATLPQLSLLNAPYTVAEVVELARIPHQSGTAVDKEIVSQALELMDIGYLAQRLYPDLSGGEKQRVQLARVMAQIWRAEDAITAGDSARLLLLDEPTAALDFGHQTDLMQAVSKFSDAGVGVVMVLHDINLAARYAHKILAMQCSQVVAYGGVNDVITTANMQTLFSTPLTVIHNNESGTPSILRP